MKSRILVAVVGIPLLLVILLLTPPICLQIVVGLLSVLALYELLYATGYVRYFSMLVISAVAAFLVPFWCYFGPTVLGFVGICFLLLVGLCICAIASGQTVKLGQIGACFFAGIVIPLMLSTFVLMRDMPHARVYLLLPFVSAFTSDAFALFAGMAFGKHKLAPVLSPKKTIEGSVGGFVGSVACCVLYGMILQQSMGFVANFSVLVLYGLVGSLISQLGDLSFSYIKREFGIKDYGHLMPGHGGVLDRFDSVIFCAPATYLLVSVLPFFYFYS